MRFLLAAFSGLAAIVYAAGALHFHAQERAARTPEAIALTSLARIHHPEAALGRLRAAFEANDFSEELEPWLHRALREVPSFYQPPFLLAAYHANRLERPALVRNAFEAALARYPANGRLRLTYAQWLYGAIAEGIAPVVAVREEAEDIAAMAERQLARALALEPDLTGIALDLLARHRVAPERWVELAPDDLGARRQLLLFLAQRGEKERAALLLREVLEGLDIEDARAMGLLRQAPAWALDWGDPELALRAARRWQEREEKTRGVTDSRAALFVARAELELGEPDAAYASFRENLKRIEEGLGASSRAALELLCDMGYEYLRRGQVTLAQSLFSEAKTLGPSYTPASLGLARVYRRSGNNGAAVEEYRALLRRHPGNAEARRELERLLLEEELRRRSR